MIDDFYALQRDVEDLNREYSEKLGQFKQMKKQIRKEFGCKTATEAAKLVEKLHTEMMDTAESYTKKKRQYEKELKKARRKLK